MNQPEHQDKNRQQYIANLTLAGMAGQVGCLTLVVVFIALFLGLWLDKYFETKPLFTVILLIGSVPVTLFLMFRVAMSAVERIKPTLPQKNQSTEEESDLGNHS